MELLCYGGWYGSGNLGDEAILIGTRKIFEKVLPEARLNVLSINPDHTSSVCHVESVRLESPRSLLRNRRNYLELFRNAKACLVTGGTPFYDYGHISRIIHMGLPALNEKKMVCFGVGSKPINTLRGREITRVLLRNSHRISTRDVESKDILKQVIRSPVKKLNYQTLNVTGDSALFLAPDVKRNLDENTVLFCPRRLTHDNKTLYHEHLDQTTINRIRHMQAKAADEFIRQGYEVKFTPFHTVRPDDDMEEIRIIRNLMTEKEGTVLPRPKTPVDGLRLIAEATLVVGLRLHSLVLASSCGVPFTTLDYDIKIRGFMSHMGLGELCGKPTGSIHKLGEISVEAAENQKDHSKRILSRVKEIRGKILDEAKQVALVIQDLNEEKDMPGRLRRGIRSR